MRLNLHPHQCIIVCSRLERPSGTQRRPKLKPTLEPSLPVVFWTSASLLASVVSALLCTFRQHWCLLPSTSSPLFSCASSLHIHIGLKARPLSRSVLTRRRKPWVVAEGLRSTSNIHQRRSSPPTSSSTSGQWKTSRGTKIRGGVASIRTLQWSFSPRRPRHLGAIVVTPCPLNLDVDAP